MTNTDPAGHLRQSSSHDTLNCSAQTERLCASAVKAKALPKCVRLRSAGGFTMQRVNTPKINSHKEVAVRCYARQRCTANNSDEPTCKPWPHATESTQNLDLQQSTNMQRSYCHHNGCLPARKPPAQPALSTLATRQHPGGQTGSTYYTPDQTCYKKKATSRPQPMRP
jgi:hypothetical protein